MTENSFRLPDALRQRFVSIGFSEPPETGVEARNKLKKWEGGQCDLNGEQITALQRLSELDPVVRRLSPKESDRRLGKKISRKRHSS